MRSQPLREQEHKALKGHASGFQFRTREICCNICSIYGVVRHLDFIFLKVFNGPLDLMHFFLRWTPLGPAQGIKQVSS